MIIGNIVDISSTKNIAIMIQQPWPWIFRRMDDEYGIDNADNADDGAMMGMKMIILQNL